MRGKERCAKLVGELLRIQEEVTDLVHSLVLFWEPVGELTPAERTGFADTVAALATRLGRMHELEERYLFVECDHAIPADDQLDWAEACTKLEANRTSRDSWVSQVTALAHKWPA